MHNRSKTANFLEIDELDKEEEFDDDDITQCPNATIQQKVMGTDYFGTPAFLDMEKTREEKI